MPVTFVVSTDSGPELGTPVADQLPAYGAFSSPDSLLLAPSSALSLSFSPDTFKNTNVNTVYYALCSNNTPLPSWLNFDPNSLTFSGTMPPPTSPSELSQSIGISLIASDVIGFAEAITGFHLVIKRHDFNFETSLQVIHITNDLPIKFTGLQNDLKLDSQPADISKLRQIVADAPSWMSFDSHTLVLSGTPPADVVSQNFSVTAHDNYGDTASTVILLQNNNSSSSDSLIGSLPPLNASIGAYFMYNLNTTLKAELGTEIRIELGAESAWLSFDSGSLTLRGLVPGNLKPQTVQINVTASQGNQSQSQVIAIHLSLPANGDSGQSQTQAGAPNATSNSTAGPGGSTPAQSENRVKTRKRWIAAAVVVPITIVFGTLLLVFCCVQRRRTGKVVHESIHSRRNISRPFHENTISSAEVKTETTRAPAMDEKRDSLAASKAPWIDLPGLRLSGANKRASEYRVSRSTIASTEHTTRPDSWGGLVPTRLKPPAVPEVCRVVEEQPRQKTGASITGKREPLLRRSASSVITDAFQTRIYSKRKMRESTLSYASPSLFSNLRQSGLGHGRNTFSQGSNNPRFGSKGVGHGDGGLSGGPSGYGIVRDSWRNLSRRSWATTEGSSNPGLERDGTQTTISSTMSCFPRPPTSNSLGKLSSPHAILEVSDDDPIQKPIIQQIFPTIQARGGSKYGASTRKQGNSNTDPFQTFHKRRIRERHSRNPLFSAGHNCIMPTGGSDSVVVVEEASTRQRVKTQRSKSPVVPLDPASTPNPSRPRSSRASPLRKKSRINYSFTARALSPLQVNRSSQGNSRSSFTSSIFGSAASEAPSTTRLNHCKESVREETDEKGNKRWLREHPNPLGINSTDVTDQELVDAGGDGEALFKVGSTKGKRLGQSAGLRHGDPANTSMRGDLENAGGSSFI